MKDCCSKINSVGRESQSVAGKTSSEDASITARVVELPPREFVLVCGDYALADLNEESGLTSIRSYSTVAELLRELREWVEASVEDADDEDQPLIQELLASGVLGDAADLFCQSSGRWWHCYHPDFGDGLEAMVSKGTNPGD